MTNTTTHPTTPQIRSLRAEAAQVGDDDMVRICDRALAGSRRALRECARVIGDDAAAQVETYYVDRAMLGDNANDIDLTAFCERLSEATGVHCEPVAYAYNPDPDMVEGRVFFETLASMVARG